MVETISQGRQRFVGRAALAEALASTPHIDPEDFRADLDRIIDGALLPETDEVAPTRDPPR